MKQELLNKTRQLYLPDRLKEIKDNLIDRDFFEFEEEMIAPKDLEKILATTTKLPNPHNSIILYLTGKTDIFDYQKARCDTIGGSPPDIDTDFEAAGKEEIVNLLAERWGRDCVSNIMALGTFKPKSLTRRFFKLSSPEDPAKADIYKQTMYEVLDKIPEPLYGKEATLHEIIEGNEDKGYSPHPDLVTDKKYASWYSFTSKMEEMVAQFGIHAAGIVLSDFPIYEQIPMWSNSKSERITQYDMKEVETLGLIKFDFLAINNLDILKECVRLIQITRGKTYNIYDIPDHDPKAYELLASGHLAGIFQMETSKSAKDLILRIKPQSIEELSDISALNRPGPLSAGYGESYIQNKANNYPPDDMPWIIADILKSTYWTLVYQEQVMKICQEVAGYSLKEADDIRRAMGKKDVKVLLPYQESFKKGFKNFGLSEEDADTWWAILLGFADYGFNKSHSVAYSFITYLCAYFKANYTQEFFTALMSIRGSTMQPKLWAEKAPEYIQEAKEMGIHIRAPSVQNSIVGFSIQDNNIYFGLNAIRSVGATASKAIISARGKTRFKDIWDFMGRINPNKVTSKTIESLIKAGAFDTMGYKRDDLLNNLEQIVAYLPSIQEYQEHERKRIERDKEYEKIEALQEELDNRIKEAKAEIKALKKAKQPIPYHLDCLVNFKEYKAQIDSGEIPQDGIPDELMELIEKYGNLRKLPKLKPKQAPEMPHIERHKEIVLTVEDLMSQAEYIGCYVGRHPARVLFPRTNSISVLEEGTRSLAAGQVTDFKEIVTRKGQPMAFAKLNDGTATAEITIFPRDFEKLKTKNALPKTGDIIAISGRVERVEPIIKIIVSDIAIHRSNN